MSLLSFCFLVSFTISLKETWTFLLHYNTDDVLSGFSSHLFVLYPCSTRQPWDPRRAPQRIVARKSLRMAAGSGVPGLGSPNVLGLQLPEQEKDGGIWLEKVRWTDRPIPLCSTRSRELRKSGYLFFPNRLFIFCVHVVGRRNTILSRPGSALWTEFDRHEG